MHRAAEKLAAVRVFMGNRNIDSLLNNGKFNKHHQDLEKLLNDVVKKSPSEFGDPWGLLALHRAATRRCPQSYSDGGLA